MFRRVLSGFLLKILLAALAGLALSLWLPSLGIDVRSPWVLAVGVAVAAGLFAVLAALLRALARSRDVDLSPSELTTLTFPPEGRLQRSQRR